MPQLDMMTFFTQFFWFSLSFIFFYLLLLHYILPSIALNLKFRKELLTLFINDIQNKKKVTLSIFLVFDDIIFKTLHFFRMYIDKLLKFSSLWIFSNLIKSNINYFIKANNHILKVTLKHDFTLIALKNITFFKNSQGYKT